MGSRFAEKFAEFTVGVRYEDLPRSVVEQARWCILDFLGVALAGGNLGLAPSMTELICGPGGEEEATIIGHHRRVPVLNAALLNSVRGHTLDMDDGHRYANAHPGVVVVPAALAVAEKVDATLGEFIQAMVAGYEIMIRIARAMNPSHLQRGFHSTGTAGPFGAAAACSNLLRLDGKQCGNALAIAGLQGAGLLQVTASGQMMKPLQPGRAAQAGTLAAMLARRGSEGPDEILEGEKGFFRAFSDSVDFTALTDGLGAAFEILGVYFKGHAACRHVHPTLDALAQTVKANGITLEEIEKIEVNTYPVAYSLTGRPKEAGSELAAKFSIPVSVALMLIHGRAGTGEFTARCLQNPAVKSMAGRVVVSPDEWRGKVYPAKRGSAVSVSTARGTFRGEVEIPKGDPENPFSPDELTEKFLSNASEALPAEAAMNVRDLVMGDGAVPVREIMRLVCTPRVESTGMKMG